MTSITCASCRFMGNPEEWLHQCRRHAPVVQLREASYIPLTVWPVVFPTDSCGDFEPKESE